MSRVYDALQRSQGENQNAAAAPPPQPTTPRADPAAVTPEKVSATGMPVMSIPVESMPFERLQHEGSVTAETGETGYPFEGAVVGNFSEPQTPSAAYQETDPWVNTRPSASLRTEALQSSVIAGTTTPSHWLNVPTERILRPHPTPEQRLVTLAEPNSPGAEMFRVLSTRLAHLQHKRPLRKVVITSSVGDEGKSVVSANLALALAKRAGERTLLIEADLRRPSAAALFSSSPLKGISDWADGTLGVEEIVYQVSGLPLWFLPAGHAIDESQPLLESERFAELLQTLSVAFDWVVIDATPMLPMADAASLARLSDGVLVVVREGFTRRKILNKALETIEPNKLLGMVLNEASMLQVGYDRYYVGYSKNGKSKRLPSEDMEKVKVVTA